MRKVSIFMSAILVALLTSHATATFIVEAHSGGLANANFVGTKNESSAGSSAVGLTSGLGSVFGSAVYQQPADYLYQYTLDSDIDNYYPSYGVDFGNGDLATGLTGGVTGYYNVYITWGASTNVNPLGCKITVTSEGLGILHENVDMNTGGTGTPGANNAWWKIADYVLLTSGNTYTVRQESYGNDYVSQRSHGVMWEFVEVPEPATLLLIGFGALAFRRRRTC